MGLIIILSTCGFNPIKILQTHINQLIIRPEAAGYTASCKTALVSSSSCWTWCRWLLFPSLYPKPLHILPLASLLAIWITGNLNWVEISVSTSIKERSCRKCGPLRPGQGDPPCNALYVELSQKVVKKLQLVQPSMWDTKIWRIEIIRYVFPLEAHRELLKTIS